MKKLRVSATLALTVVAILYTLANVAYFAAVPKAELKAAKEISASLLFKHVFGSSSASKGLNFLIALSSFGNLITVLLGDSRLIRECGRYTTFSFFLLLNSNTDHRSQTRRPPVAPLLGLNPPFWNTPRPLFPQMVTYRHHDPRSSRRRRFQLCRRP